MNIWEAIVLPGVAWGIAWVMRRLGKEAFWEKVRGDAKVILADPLQTADPKLAVQQALLQAQMDRLAVEVAKVRAAFELAGDVRSPSQSIPRLDITLEPVEVMPSVVVSTEDLTPTDRPGGKRGDSL